MVLGFGKSLSQLLKKASATQARQKADTSQPGHTHNNKESQGSQGGALTSVIPTPVPQPDNVMNNNFASDKAQALGADLFEGQEMVQQQNDIKNMRSTPSNLPGGRPENSSSYGDMFFNSPMNQGFGKYKKGELLDDDDFSEISGQSDLAAEKYSDIQEDKKGQYVTSLGKDEYFKKSYDKNFKRPTSSKHIDKWSEKEVLRDTIRPRSGKAFISSWKKK